MRVCRSPLALALLAVLGLPLAAPAGPGPQVSVQLDRTSAQVGQPVLVTVRVRGATDTPTVKPPEVEGATLVPLGKPRVVSSLAADLEAQGVLHAGSGQQFTNALKGILDPAALGALDPDLKKRLGDPAVKGMTGLDRNDYFFTYQLTPQKAGPLAVPAFSVTSDGATTTTKPVSIDIGVARPQPWARMALSLSNPTPTVGEEVRLHVDLLIQRSQVAYGGKTYPHLPVKEMSLQLPGLEGNATFDLVKSLETIIREGAVEPGHRGFRINDIAGEVKLEHEPADRAEPGLDPARYRRRLTIPLRMKEGGPVTLPPARAAGDIYLPSGNRGRWEPFVAVSEPLTFTVIDLRGRADRPADFGGAVGPLKVTARASQTKLAVGTPFTLTVRLEGPASLAQVTAPDLAARPEFARAFRVRSEEERTDGLARKFTYTLRPLNTDVKEVPPVEVSFYDPRANQFGTARSAALPLEVSPASNATPDAPPPPAAAPPPPASPDAAPPAANADDLPAPSALDRLWAWAEAGLFLVCTLAVALVGLRTFHKHRRRRAAHRQHQAVLSEVRRELEEGEPTVAAVRQTVQDFLRRRFGMPPGEVTAAEARERLKASGIEPELTQAVADLLDTCASAEFAPGTVTVSPPELAAYARRLIERLGGSPVQT